MHARVTRPGASRSGAGCETSPMAMSRPSPKDPPTRSRRSFCGASKAPPMPVVLFGRNYWTKVVNFNALVEFGMLDRNDLALFDIVDDAEEAWSAMIRRGLVAHTPR